jgi:hypothetical protein
MVHRILRIPILLLDFIIKIAEWSVLFHRSTSRIINAVPHEPWMVGSAASRRLSNSAGEEEYDRRGSKEKPKYDAIHRERLLTWRLEQTRMQQCSCCQCAGAILSISTALLESSFPHRLLPPAVSYVSYWNSAVMLAVSTLWSAHLDRPNQREDKYC